MNLKTTLHIKTFQLRDAADAKAYAELNDKLAAMGLRQFKFGHQTGAADRKGADYRNRLHTLDGREVELETDFLFENQWNTAPIDGHNGLRVFDWQDFGIFDVPTVRTVQWLEQTDEMNRARVEHFKCGFCGAMYHLPEQVFCDRCLDSEYLKAEDLYLLRLQAIDGRAPNGLRNHRRPLADAEREELLPRYRQAQLHGATERGRKRIADAKRRVEEKYAKVTADALVERDGHRWLLDNLPAIDANAIYYNHTGRWCFGWRNPVDGDVLDQLLEKISEFPFPYDIKASGDRTLSGER